MTDNPIEKVLQRTLNMAMLHGIGFLKVSYDADKQEFLFTNILPEFITVSYEKSHD